MKNTKQRGIVHFRVFKWNGRYLGICKELGFVEPYYKNTLFGEYAYLKWQRYGFPIGDSFPIALIEGTTTALPFGIQGELLRVKIGKITSFNVDLTIDQSDIQTEIGNIDKTLPENVEAIGRDVQKKTEPVINDINKNLEKNVQPIVNEISNNLNKFNNDISLRINKAIERNYHSSLHVIDVSNSKLKQVSVSIKNKEAELAEDIADSVVSAVLNYAALSTGVIGAGLTYNTLIKQVPSNIRHNITNFIYNIEDTSDDSAEDNLADKGIATLYIGNPNSNKVSAQFNDYLKSKGLPYFEDNKIVGKRNYSAGDIGIIAAIPEETYWAKDTLQQRWDNDRIRLYKTLIAGIDNDGLDVAVLWYNKQLDLARTSIASTIKLIGGYVDEQGLETKEILDGILNVAKNDPKASIGFAAIAQGWILTGISSLQKPDFNKIDSLGYVVIVKKEGNSYRTLETHSLVGDKRDYFLDEYQEIINKVEDVSKVTGEVVKTVEETDKLVNEPEGIIKKESGNFMTRFFKKILGWF